MGLDVGFSPKRASGAICRLEWDRSRLHWECRRFRYDARERRDAICAIAGERIILAAAFDGPFRGALDPIGEYRAAESFLTRRVAGAIGKPGASNAPIGKFLNKATNEAIADVLACARVQDATHRAPVHAHAVVEAFPNSFMGVMLPNGHSLAKGRAGKSDRYYESLCGSGALAKVLRRLVPGRTSVSALESVLDHDDRAALICAITALCVVAGDYVAVGDANGRIILPPRSFWNATIFDLVAQSCAAAPSDAQAMIVMEPQSASDVYSV